MRSELVDLLRARRPQTEARWRDLLRADRANTPLACPDVLVHLIGRTLVDVEKTLLNASHRERIARWMGHADCQDARGCQRNPFAYYFAAGRQALQEALVLSQAVMPGLTPGERDTEMEELNLALHVLAQKEIEAFCGVCQFRVPLRSRAPFASFHPHGRVRENSPGGFPAQSELRRVTSK
jgi:hypothetical protein